MADLLPAIELACKSARSAFAAVGALTDAVFTPKLSADQRKVAETEVGAKQSAPTSTPCEIHGQWCAGKTCWHQRLVAGLAGDTVGGPDAGGSPAPASGVGTVQMSADAEHRICGWLRAMVRNDRSDADIVRGFQRLIAVSQK